MPWSHTVTLLSFWRSNCNNICIFFFAWNKKCILCGSYSWKNSSILKTGIAWCSKGGKLVEELRVFLLAAHSGHSAHIQWQVSDKPACRQLVYLQDILHIMDIVDQQMVLVHTRHKACRKIKEEVMQNVLGEGGGCQKQCIQARHCISVFVFLSTSHYLYFLLLSIPDNDLSNKE